MIDNLPELLAPAGSIEALLAAVAAGADAVYCGLGSFNARASAAKIDPRDFMRACALAHAHGVRVYVTCNVYLRPGELDHAVSLARWACHAGADALIVADAGLVAELRRTMPQVEIHLSTQAGVMSRAGVEFARHELGVERVTVARELSIDEIAEVCAEGTSIEVFCHGAICVCYSGACAHSSLRRARSANRGDCTQPCRFAYDLVDGEGASVNAREGDRLLCPRDYCSIEHLDELVAAGVGALKIEGRMKNPDYVYNVVSTYRRALDAVGEGTYGPELAAACKRQLARSFNRGFTDAYLRGRSGAELMSFERACNQGVAVGELVECRYEEVDVRFDADVRAGDMLEIRSTPGPDAPADVPKRWPQVPCPRDARAGEVAAVHCKRKVEVGSIVHCISSGDVLERSRAAVERARAELMQMPCDDALVAEFGAWESADEASRGGEAEAATAGGAVAVMDAADRPVLRLTVLADTPQQASLLATDPRVDRVAACVHTVEEDPSAWEDVLGQMGIVLDEACRAVDGPRLSAFAERAPWVICRNPGELALVRATGVPFEVAAPISVTHSDAAASWRQAGAGCIWLPDELSCEEVAAVARAYTGRAGALVFGRPQLMVTEHELWATKDQGAHSSWSPSIVFSQLRGRVRSPVGPVRAVPRSAILPSAMAPVCRCAWTRAVARARLPRSRSHAWRACLASPLPASRTHWSTRACSPQTSSNVRSMPWTASLAHCGSSPAFLPRRHCGVVQIIGWPCSRCRGKWDKLDKLQSTQHRPKRRGRYRCKEHAHAFC